MSRNVKPEYLRKLLAIDRNGYKFDLANYLHNPEFGYECLSPYPPPIAPGHHTHIGYDRR